jgi:hypothetical protein
VQYSLARRSLLLAAEPHRDSVTVNKHIIRALRRRRCRSREELEQKDGARCRRRNRDVAVDQSLCPKLCNASRMGREQRHPSASLTVCDRVARWNHRDDRIALRRRGTCPLVQLGYRRHDWPEHATLDLALAPQATVDGFAGSGRTRLR